jgi:hypothetical protein
VRRGGAPQGGSDGRAGIVSSGEPTGPERGRPCAARVQRLGQGCVCAELIKSYLGIRYAGIAPAGCCLAFTAVDIEPEGIGASCIGGFPAVRGSVLGAGEVDLKHGGGKPRRSRNGIGHILDGDVLEFFGLPVQDTQLLVAIW